MAGGVTMKTPFFATAAACSLLLSSSIALAQDDAPTDAPPPPPPPPVVVAPAPAAPAAPAPSIGECSLGTHAGVDDADAQTATDIVCAEVSHRGMHPGARYRVGLGRLGHTVVLSLTMETAPGVIAEHRQMELSGIEEVPVAAPRLSDAVNRGEAIEETQRVGNVVQAEARPPLTKKGDIHFSVGVLALMPPIGTSGTPAPGMEMAFTYEWNNFSAGVGFRAAGNSASDNNGSSVGFVGLSVGGRYYLTDTDIAPYVGSGLVWSYEQVTNGTYSSGASNQGIGAYGEIGVTALRTHRSHLSLGVRADLPFYSLNSNVTNESYASGSGTPSYVTPSPLYAVPVTIDATFTF